MTLNEIVRARFIDVDEYSITLRVKTFIKTDDFSKFLEVAEDLNLRIVDIVKETGTWFAVPSQTIKIEEAEKMDDQRRIEVEGIVAD